MHLRRATRAAFVGLDLSPGRIKLVALAAGADGPSVACAVDEPFRDGLDGGPTPFDAAATGARVAALLARHRVRARTVALVLGPAEAVTRRVARPGGDPAAVRAALARALGQALGAEGAEPRVAWAETGDDPAAVLAAGARPEAVAAQLRAVAAGRLPAGPVLPAAAALLHAWRACPPQGAPARAVLLHVGHAAAQWLAVDGGVPLALDAPLVGVGAVREGAGGPRGGDLDAWAGRLRQEIARGLQPLRAGGGGPAFPPVWVSGGGARVPGLLAALRRAMSVPVHAYDPLRDLPWVPGAGDVFGPAMVPALGAALQAAAAAHGGPTLLALDLRAPEDARAGGAPRLPLPLLVRTLARDGALRGVAAAALALWATTAVLDARVRAGEGRVAEREARAAADSAAVAGALARAREAEADRRGAGDRAAVAAALARGRYAWPRLLHAVAAALPPAAWVTDVVPEAEPPGGALSARVRGYAASEAVAAAFARGLSREGARAEVTRTAAVRIGREDAVRFEVAVRAETPGAAAGGMP